MKGKTFCGACGFSAKLLRLSADAVIEALTVLIHHSAGTGFFSNSPKLAQVVAVFKHMSMRIFHFETDILAFTSIKGFRMCNVQRVCSLCK